MKNLGKILILITLIPLSLMADIKASVDSPNVERGDMVTYEIMLNGDNIVRPIISTLCGQNVISTATQTSIQMINGTMTKSYIFAYKFLPQESCVIDPVEVEIDSQIYKTNSVKVNVSKLTIKKDSPFILTLESDKKEVFMGESFNMKLLFKQKDEAEAIDSEFIAPNFKGFWIKDESKAKRYKENGYTITEKVYKLAAQRVGKLKISSAQMRIAFRTHTRDPWAGVISRIKWKSYYSNELNIDVKAIPNGLDLVGEFKISAEIDKLSIKKNEAVNVSIRVVGDGNLEDIASFKPNMNGVNVFDEKITIEDGVLMQKMAFVSDRDFTVPSFEVKFFNPKSKKIEITKTKPFIVKVKNSNPKQEELTIKRDDKKNIQKEISSSSASLSNFSNILVFIAGVIVGILISLIRVFKRTKNTKLLKPLDIKNEKLLLIKLLPYKDDLEVRKILDLIEENLYSDAKKILDKKLLKEIFKRYDIV